MKRHIFLLIWNQRKSNAWLWIELMLASLFLWVIVDYFYVTTQTYFSPLGYNIEHTYQIVLNELSDKSDDYIAEDRQTTTIGEDILTAVDRIRTYPGIENVSVSYGGMPYNPGSRTRNVLIDTTSVHVHFIKVSPTYFDVFRIPLPEEKTLRFNRQTAEPDVVILSEDAVENVPGFLLGSILHEFAEDSIGNTIRGVCAPQRRHDYTIARPTCFLSLTDQKIATCGPGESSQLEVCVRVRPEADRDFATRFRKDMSRQIRIGNIYLLDVRPISSVRQAYILTTGAENEWKTRLSIALFLLINIFLGIIGTFWFRTEYRKGEMGLRMALGSTRNQLRSIFFQEGTFLLILAFIPALFIGLNLAYGDLIDKELMPFTWVRFLICQAITFLLIAGMIRIGIWYPARQTSRLEPAEALHYE